MFFSDMIAKDKNDTMRNSLVSASFVAWQTNQTKKSFNEYLKLLGLEEKSKPISKNKISELAKNNIDLAEKIMAADRKKHEEII